MQRYTTGGLSISDMGPRDECFFYYPEANDPADFTEPFCVNITRLAASINRAVMQRVYDKGATAGMPEGLEFTYTDVDAAYAQRAINHGVAERPLIENAKRFLQAGGLEQSIILYACNSPLGVDPVKATVIDGMHRYCAAYELGIARVFSCFVRDPMLYRHKCAGLPYELVKSMLAEGPDDTTRYDFERKHGMRNADGSLKE